MKHPSSHNLSVLKVHPEQNAGSENTLPKFFMNLCTQAPGHRSAAIYNLGVPTPWVQHAALVSIAPEGHSGIREGQLKQAWGGSSCRRWRHQKGCKFAVWSPQGRLRPPEIKVYPLPSWFYKGNAELLFAKSQNIRTMGNSVKLVLDRFKAGKEKLLHRMGSELLEIAATAVGRQMV